MWRLNRSDKLSDLLFPKKVSLLIRWLFLFLFICSIWAFSTNPFANYTPTDSAVFSYVGNGMMKGLVPYKDIFDHKGPLLYFLNYLGLSFKIGLQGIWLVEIAFYLASLLIVLNYLVKTFSSRVAIFALVPYVAFFTYGLNAGNFSESYAHLFIVFSITCLLDNIKKNQHFSRLESFLIGISFSGILLLRPNLGCVAIPIMIFFINQVIFKKTLKISVINGLLILFGMGCLMLPFLFYLIVHNAMVDFIWSYWTYNLYYLANSRLSWTSNFYICIVMILLSIGPFFDRKVRSVAIYNSIFVFVTIISLITASCFTHYYLAIVPASIFILGWWGDRMILNKNYKTICLIVVISLGVLSLENLKSNFDVAGIMKAYQTNKNVNVIAYREGWYKEELLSLRCFFEDGDSLYVLGNSCECYRILGLTTKSKYPYLPGAETSEIFERVKTHILQGKDDYVITLNSDFPSKWLQIVRQTYVTVAKTQRYTLWKRRYDN